MYQSVADGGLGNRSVNQSLYHNQSTMDGGRRNKRLGQDELRNTPSRAGNLSINDATYTPEGNNMSQLLDNTTVKSARGKRKKSVNKGGRRGDGQTPNANMSPNSHYGRNISYYQEG